MNVRIFPSDEFLRLAKRFSKKYKSFVKDLMKFQDELQNNPFLGKDLGGGKRKVRVQVASKGKGKSSGMRVITFLVDQTATSIDVYLVTIYDKSEYSSVSERYVDQIIKDLK